MKMKLAVLSAVVGLVTLVGCASTTTTTTTASLTYLNSPTTVDRTNGRTSAFQFGASVQFEIDRGTTRAGICGLAGYEWAGEPSVTVSGKEATIPSSNFLGSYCYKQDLAEPGADSN